MGRKQAMWSSVSPAGHGRTSQNMIAPHRHPIEIDTHLKHNVKSIVRSFTFSSYGT